MADLRGVRGTCPPNRNSLNFMQFLGKFDEIVCWRPPPLGGVGAPSSGKFWIRHWTTFPQLLLWVGRGWWLMYTSFIAKRLIQPVCVLEAYPSHPAGSALTFIMVVYGIFSWCSQNFLFKAQVRRNFIHNLCKAIYWSVRSEHFLQGVFVQRLLNYIQFKNLISLF